MAFNLSAMAANLRVMGLLYLQVSFRLDPSVFRLGWHVATRNRVSTQLLECVCVCVCVHALLTGVC